MKESSRAVYMGEKESGLILPRRQHRTFFRSTKYTPRLPLRSFKYFDLVILIIYLSSWWMAKIATRLIPHQAVPIAPFFGPECWRCGLSDAMDVLRNEGYKTHSLGEAAPAGRKKICPVPWKQRRRAMNDHVFGPVLPEEGSKNERYGMSA